MSSLFGFGKPISAACFRTNQHCMNLQGSSEILNAIVSKHFWDRTAYTSLLTSLYDGDMATLDAMHCQLLSKSAPGSKLSISKMPSTQKYNYVPCLPHVSARSEMDGPPKKSLGLRMQQREWRSYSNTNRDPVLLILTYISCHYEKDAERPPVVENWSKYFNVIFKNMWT